MKQNYKTVDELINDKMHDMILIVLSNLHSICLVGDHIIDPIYNHGLPRVEKCIRLCAELIIQDSLSNVIKKAYSFDCLAKTKSGSS